MTTIAVLRLLALLGIFLACVGIIALITHSLDDYERREARKRRAFLRSVQRGEYRP